jgi:hypothetical protein
MSEDVIEYPSAMHELISTNDENSLGRVIAGVLEFLTARAIIDGPYYITTDDQKAITVFAADDEAESLRESLPEHYKSWEDPLSEEDFLTNADPGDEQDESTSESE